jgi:glycosyltransferase involved in cell wall biosynthesis
LREVLDTGRKITLLIVGDGPLRADLELFAKSLNLNGHAIFLGFRTDVWRLLQASDLFVLPTLGEGFGLAVLEAMAAGKPVIASAVTSIPEIVVDGLTGILVPPKDIQALVEALCLLVDEPEKVARMGQAGRRVAVEEFSPIEMVQATQGVYEDLFS